MVLLCRPRSHTHQAGRQRGRPLGTGLVAVVLVLATAVLSGCNYPVAFASYLMAMAPLFVVYVFAQRWVISGVTRGAVK